MRGRITAVVLLLACCLVSRADAGANPGGGIRMTPRIVGGTPVDDSAKYPWMVALVASGSQDFNRNQFCGGTLIHPEWVLTAAHCLKDENGNSISPSSVDVLLGTADLAQPDTGYEQIFSSRLYIHPDYNLITQDNDIALIRLSRRSAQSPIGSLAAGDADTQPGLSYTVIGWGETQPQPRASFYPSQLQEVDLPIVSNAVCDAGMSESGYVTENMICAGVTEGGKDSCFGDSGGPLVRMLDGGSHTLVGVVSWGEGCAQAGTYGVYTKVSRYTEWIDGYLHPVSQPGTGSLPVSVIRLLLDK